MLDAGAIVGLLADEDRRKVFAAVELGAATFDDIARVTGLSAPLVARATGRLAQAGLVVDAGGALVVASATFQHAAREALSRAKSTEHEALPEAARKVMSAFVTDGRLTSIPTAHAKRMVVLDW